ncbi:hypothetical protein Glove_309g47 [Diversispora epigaea]|uniref:Uncharacterized protein n=1 Tax=Diversispora epigaea TaxID=1348612 RepID=A0A397HSA8_9GLOM|nr:hypothetical protein Glove_309g47 [Diversispora epigaea]
MFIKILLNFHLLIGLLERYFLLNFAVESDLSDEGSFFNSSSKDKESLPSKFNKSNLHDSEERMEEEEEEEEMQLFQHVSQD